MKILKYLLHRRLDAPDVTGSSLTLGAAGSRRTVYLIDENPKLPDSSAQSNDSDPHVTNNRSGAATSNNNNNGNNNNNHADQVPSTFLMYNRISNVIGDTKVIGNGSSSQHSPNNALTDNGNASKDKRSKEEEKAIWYEYGCVWMESRQQIDG